MKKLYIATFLLVAVGVVSYGIMFLPSVEDVYSYDITSRYDCHQIQDSIEYSECVSFYFSKTPYELGDVLVPVKRIK